MLTAAALCTRFADENMRQKHKSHCTLGSVSREIYGARVFSDPRKYNV